MSYAIETNGLYKTYRGDIQALKPIDLRVRVGCCFGLLGPNGAGKSTLIKTLLSIVHASGGSAALLGRDFRLPQTRRSIGYLPEGHRFPNYLTGKQVCRYFGRLSGLSGGALDADIDKKLELVAMREWADTKITKYSKGMLQRLGLAQAMLGDPALIFLDEPTDGVDPVGRHELRDVIRSIQQRGMTVFLNSHLLSEVEAMCDEVAILDRGRLVKQGSVEEITTSVNTTGSGCLVKFKTSHVDDAVLSLLPPLLEASADGKAMACQLSSNEEISPIIDILRQHNVSIYGIEQAKLDLEDAFIKLIKTPLEQSDLDQSGSATQPQEEAVS